MYEELMVVLERKVSETPSMDTDVSYYKGRKDLFAEMLEIVQKTGVVAVNVDTDVMDELYQRGRETAFEEVVTLIHKYIQRKNSEKALS